MKKNLFYVAAFAMTALFAACSDSNEIEPQVPEQPQHVMWDKDGKGYISFRVSMPIDKTTRANDNFDQGTAWEYMVKDVHLILFKGANEANAKFQEYVKMNDIEFGEPQGGNITLDKKWVAKIGGMEIGTDEHVYALAVVNHNKVFTADGGTLKIGGHEITSETKFSDIQGYIMNTNLNANGEGTGANAALQTSEGGILMLNAPLCDAKGSTTTEIPSTRKLNILQEVTNSIYPTENLAREGECANIYVERAVAKVTVTHTEKTGTNAAFTWDLQDWRLDNTNTESYVIRNMSNFGETYNLKSKMPNGVYRMVGAATVKHNSAISAGEADPVDRYRTYFAVDPNYDEAAKAFNPGAETAHSFGSANAEYCAENVFNVKHQVWGQTTRVIVKAILTPKSGDSFYAHPGDEKYLSQATVKELAYNFAIGEYRKAIKAFRDKSLLDGSITYADATATIDGGHDKVTVVLPTTANITVASSVTDEVVADANIPGITTKDALETKLAELNTQYASQDVTHDKMGVRHYNGGASFYQIRIKHFGDDLTPWNDNEFTGAANGPKPGITIDAAYPELNRNENYLGRYGVLRNNWYEVNVTDVVKIGYATTDDLKLDGSHEVDPNTPDDHIEKEQWINAEVNILSWAKRLQNNNLGED